MASVNAPMAVRVEGLRALQATLRKTDRDALLAVRGVTVTAADVVAAEARRLAPHRSGRLAGSIKSSVRGASVGVMSPLPYANVVHWGGTISPRGVPIHFARRPFIYDATDRTHAVVERALKTGFAAVARRNGW